MFGSGEAANPDCVVTTSVRKPRRGVLLAGAALIGVGAAVSLLTAMMVDATCAYAADGAGGAGGSIGGAAAVRAAVRALQGEQAAPAREMQRGVLRAPPESFRHRMAALEASGQTPSTAGAAAAAPIMIRTSVPAAMEDRAATVASAMWTLAAAAAAVVVQAAPVL